MPVEFKSASLLVKLKFYFYEIGIVVLGVNVGCKVEVGLNKRGCHMWQHDESHDSGCHHGPPLLICRVPYSNKQQVIWSLNIYLSLCRKRGGGQVKGRRMNKETG